MFSIWIQVLMCLSSDSMLQKSLPSLDCLLLGFRDYVILKLFHSLPRKSIIIQNSGSQSEVILPHGTFDNRWRYNFLCNLCITYHHWLKITLWGWHHLQFHLSEENTEHDTLRCSVIQLIGKAKIQPQAMWPQSRIWLPYASLNLLHFVQSKLRTSLALKMYELGLPWWTSG